MPCMTHPRFYCQSMFSSAGAMRNVTKHPVLVSALFITCWVSCPLDKNLATLARVYLHVEVCFKETCIPIQLLWVSKPSLCFPFALDFQSNFQYNANKRQVEQRDAVMATGALTLISFGELKMSHLLYAQF